MPVMETFSEPDTWLSDYRLTDSTLDFPPDQWLHSMFQSAHERRVKK